MKKGGKTRLERFIARVVGQRSCIDAAAQFTAQLQGNVWEVGLGIGRIILVGLDKRLDVSVEPVKA